MKRVIRFIPWLFLLAASCSKNLENQPNSLIISGIKLSKGSELVRIKPDSGIISTTPLDSYVFGSGVFDIVSNSYGFVNGDSVFVLLDPITGIIKMSVQLPGYLSQAVIDDNDHTLIGKLTSITYVDDSDTIDSKTNQKGTPLYTNYILRADLQSSKILSRAQVDVGEGIFACSYFYDKIKKEYFILRAGNNLISVDPSNSI